MREVQAVAAVLEAQVSPRHLRQASSVSERSPVSDARHPVVSPLV